MQGDQATAADKHVAGIVRWHATGSGKTMTFFHSLLHSAWQARSPASLRRNIADLGWLRNAIAHQDIQLAMPVGSQPSSTGWSPSPGDENELDRGLLTFIGEQSPVAWHPVARHFGCSLLSLVQSCRPDEWASSTRSPGGAPPILALIARLFDDLGEGLRRLVAGIRAALCLILLLVSSALSRDPPACTYLVMLAASRRFGHRGDPDQDALPAFMSMSVVIGETAHAV